MTLLSEMVRLLSDESNLINDATDYSVISATYATIHDYGNVVLSKAGILLIKFKAVMSNGWGYFRIRIGATLFSYACKASANPPVTCSFMVYLAAGTYDVLAEGASAGGTSCHIYDFQAGFTNFSDLTGEALVAYTGAIAKTTTIRVTPVGNLKNTVYAVTIYGWTPAAENTGFTNLENPGEELTNGVRIYLDGVQQPWSERYQGDVAERAAGGKCYVATSAGVSHSVTITKDYVSTTISINVAVCPWILPYALSEIVALDFPQGSTLYLTEEPLDANPTKYVYVGKIRGVTFGAATDYYASASATGISAFSYTFESVKASQCMMTVYGLGACVSIIAMDLR